MTNKQILKKAIGKAVKNGYGKDWGKIEGGLVGYIQTFPLFEIIFSHDFAKTFWKDDKYPFGKKCPIYPEMNCAEALGWKRHLEIMVREKEPLKYIEKFL